MKRAALAALLALSPLAAPAAIKTAPAASPEARGPKAPAPDSDLRPPLPELPAPAIERDRKVWVVFTIGGAAALALICWPRRKPAAPPPDPFAIARDKLGALRAKAGEGTPVAVSATVRRYVVDAFGLEGTGLTSEEVVSGLATRRSCPVELTNEAWHFLSGCDRAKFAPRAETPDTLTLLTNATKLIHDLEAARAKAERTL
ncbi:MAG: hypothetical protein ABIP20_08415 [Chthoniobacteraceae bacterium]